MRDSSLRLPAVMLTTQQAEIKAPAAAARISITVQADDASSLAAAQAKPHSTEIDAVEVPRSTILA